MAGVVLILLFMFVVGPIGLFVVAGIWSALFSWSLTDDRERRDTTTESAS